MGLCIHIYTCFLTSVQVTELSGRCKTSVPPMAEKNIGNSIESFSCKSYGNLSYCIMTYC
jgi:hypothetical protein